MSNQSQGAGWWLASDGRWYPPELHPANRAVAERSGGDPPSYRRLSVIVAAVAICVVLVILAIVALANRTSTGSIASGSNPSSTAPATTAPAPATTEPAVTITTLVPTTAQTTSPPASAPAPTTQPAPPPTVAAVRFCGAPRNPMGYNFCGRGTMITQPDPRTCTYFTCNPSFASGSGYMVECGDGGYSMAGGHQGACAFHRGELRPVYSGP